MVKLILRLLIMVFLLESTWAVAAQYCPHELGLDGVATSHTSFEHQLIDKAVFQADDQAEPELDNECAYCHLGAMKSLLPVAVLEPTTTVIPHRIETLLRYPHVIPRQPERPNWRSAA